MLVVSACAYRPKPSANWRVAAVEGGHLLIPPQAVPTTQLTLRNARSRRSAPDSKCRVELPKIRLEWARRTAHVTIAADEVEPLRSISLSGGKGPSEAGVPLSDLSWWKNFSSELSARESIGCVGAAESERLLQRIIDNLAMPSLLAFQLRYGNIADTGYFDLQPNFALRWVIPISHSGDVLRGFDTLIYDVKPRAAGGVKLELRSTERDVRGSVSNRHRRVAARMVIPSSALHYRYFFRAWQVSRDRKMGLLVTSRVETLDGLTRRFEASPETFCSSLKGSDAACITVPNDTTVYPEVRVVVNGKPAYLPVGATLREALGKQWKPEDLPRLAVLRPWGGRLVLVDFDRSRQDILRVTLIGGEDIRW